MCKLWERFEKVKTVRKVKDLFVANRAAQDMFRHLRGKSETPEQRGHSQKRAAAARDAAEKAKDWKYCPKSSPHNVQHFRTRDRSVTLNQLNRQVEPGVGQNCLLFFGIYTLPEMRPVTIGKRTAPLGIDPRSPLRWYGDPPLW